MKLFFRNVQFIVLVLLQIATLIILSTMMFTNFESKSNTETNYYGLKKEDFDRIKDTIETKNGTETLEHEIGRYRIEKRIESGTHSIRLSDELSIEVLDLIQKWYNADASERDRIAEEISNLVEKDPKIQDLIQSLPVLLEDLKGND